MFSQNPQQRSESSEPLLGSAPDIRQLATPESAELGQINPEFMTKSLVELDALKVELTDQIKEAKHSLESIREDQLSDFAVFKERTDTLNTLTKKLEEVDFAIIFNQSKDVDGKDEGKEIKLSQGVAPSELQPLPEEPGRVIPRPELIELSDLEYQSADEIKEAIKKGTLSANALAAQLNKLREERLTLSRAETDQDKEKYAFLKGVIEKYEGILDEVYGAPNIVTKSIEEQQYEPKPLIHDSLPEVIVEPSPVEEALNTPKPELTELSTLADIEYKSADEIIQLLRSGVISDDELKITLAKLRQERLDIKDVVTDKEKVEYLKTTIKKLEEVLDDRFGIPKTIEAGETKVEDKVTFWRKMKKRLFGIK